MLPEMDAQIVDGIWDANALVVQWHCVFVCVHALHFHHSGSYHSLCLLEQVQGGISEKLQVNECRLHVILIHYRICPVFLTEPQ